MTVNVCSKGNKLYYVIHYKGVDPKRTTKWISTGKDNNKKNKTELEKNKQAILDEYIYLEKGYYGTPVEDIRIVEALERWYAEKKNEVRQQTWESYHYIVNSVMIPYFKHAMNNPRLKEVGPRMIKEYFHYLAYKHKGPRTHKGLSRETIKKHKYVLSSMFDNEIINETVNDNPAMKVPVRANQNAGEIVKNVYYSKEEVRDMLEKIKDEKIFPLVYVAFVYALRRSEVIGLKWSSVDFEKETITIDHTIVRSKTELHTDKTKSKASMCTFRMSGEIKQLLLELKKKQDENRKLFGNCYNETGYVFTRDNGTYFKPDYVSKIFVEVLKKHNLPPMRFHDLRHSCASIMSAENFEPEQIKEWLRHAQVSTTCNIYIHKKETCRDTACGVFADLLPSVGTSV